MSCTKCETLDILIKLPKDLDNAVSILGKCLESGLITSMGYGKYSQPFESILKSGWSDIVSCYFKCNNCSQKYHLAAETYHGSGGYLRAIETIEETLNEA